MNKFPTANGPQAPSGETQSEGGGQVKNANRWSTATAKIFAANFPQKTKYGARRGGDHWMGETQGPHVTAEDSPEAKVRSTTMHETPQEDGGHGPFVTQGRGAPITNNSETRLRKKPTSDASRREVGHHYAENLGRRTDLAPIIAANGPT